jgi:hypothetical protein
VTIAADGHPDGPRRAVSAWLGQAERARLTMRTILCIVIAVLAASGCSAVRASTVGAKPTTVRTAPSASAPPVSTPTVSAPAPSGTAQSAPATGIWKLKWRADFSETAPLGSFSRCNNNDLTREAFCSGLPADLQSQWWASRIPGRIPRQSRTSC